MVREVSYEELLNEIADIVAAETVEPGNDGFRSQNEWADVFGTSRTATCLLFQKLSKLGVLEVSKAKKRSITGRPVTIPVYKIVIDKKKPASKKPSK